MGRGLPRRGRSENSNLSPSSSAPALTKKIKINTRKIQKIPKKIWVVDNLMREVRSNFQNIWTSVQLSVKKTNRRSVTMCTVHILFWSDLSFLLRAAQKSKCFENWSVPHAPNCLPPNFFGIFWFFFIFLRIFFDRVQMHPGTETRLYFLLIL